MEFIREKCKVYKVNLSRKIKWDDKMIDKMSLNKNHTVYKNVQASIYASLLFCQFS